VTQEQDLKISSNKIKKKRKDDKKDQNQRRTCQIPNTTQKLEPLQNDNQRSMSAKTAKEEVHQDKQPFHQDK